jgi:hypothetical protein
MANQPASDIYAGRFSVPSVDFAGLVAMSRNTLTETAKQNSKLYTTLQAVGKEWTEFVSARLREESQLLQTLLVGGSAAMSVAACDLDALLRTKLSCFSLDFKLQHSTWLA